MTDNYKLISQLINEAGAVGKAAKTGIGYAAKGLMWGGGALGAGILSSAGSDFYNKHEKQIAAKAAKIKQDVLRKKQSKKKT